VTLGWESPSTSWIVFHDKKSEEQELPAPETLISSSVVDGAEHRNDLESEC